MSKRANLLFIKTIIPIFSNGKLFKYFYPGDIVNVSYINTSISADSDYESGLKLQRIEYTLSEDFKLIFNSIEDRNNNVVEIAFEYTTESESQIEKYIQDILKSHNIDVNIAVYKWNDMLSCSSDLSHPIDNINEYGDNVCGYIKILDDAYDYKRGDILVVTSYPYISDDKIIVRTRLLGEHKYMNEFELSGDNLRKIEIIFTENTEYTNSELEKYFNSVNKFGGKYSYAMYIGGGIYRVEGNVFFDINTDEIKFIESRQNELSKYIFIHNMPKTNDINKLRNIFDLINGGDINV